MTHNDTTLQHMLDRFVSGQTTEVEEAELARYFRTTREVPAKWQAYQELFASFDTDLYTFSEAELDAMAAPEEPVEMTLAAPTSVPTMYRPVARRALRVAAMVALVVGVGLAAYKNLVGPSPVVGPTRHPALTAQVTPLPQAEKTVMPEPTATAAVCRQKKAPVRKVAVHQLPSAVAQETEGWQSDKHTSVAQPLVAQAVPVTLPATDAAPSCGFYADADYNQVLAQFGSLQDLSSTAYGIDAPLMASTNRSTSTDSQPTADPAPQAASIGSPFDGDVVFPRIAIP